MKDEVRLIPVYADGSHIVVSDERPQVYDIYVGSTWGGAAAVPERAWIGSAATITKAYQRAQNRRLP